MTISPWDSYLDLKKYEKTRNTGRSPMNGGGGGVQKEGILGAARFKKGGDFFHDLTFVSLHKAQNLDHPTYLYEGSHGPNSGYFRLIRG